MLQYTRIHISLNIIFLIMFLLKTKPKRPRIVRVAHKVTHSEPVTVPVVVVSAPSRHWWQDEEVEEVPWAQSLEYLRYELKLRSFGQHTSTVYLSGYRL